MTTTTPTLSETARELLALEKKATAAPWRVVGKSIGYIHGRDSTSGHSDAGVQVAVVGAYGDKELIQFSRGRWDADAALLVLARNHAPALARRVIDLQAQRHALREALIAAEDVLARYPFSTQMLPNGRHPNDLITQIRDALDAGAPVRAEAAADVANMAMMVADVCHCLPADNPLHQYGAQQYEAGRVAGVEGAHRVAKDEPWPEGISDGLVLACGVCGTHPSFDYTVRDEIWAAVAPRELRRSVICLPCFDRLASRGGISIGEHLEQVQFTGVGKTVVLRPTATYVYPPQKGAGDQDGLDGACQAPD